jgi:hypothetical protein
MGKLSLRERLRYSRGRRPGYRRRRPGQVLGKVEQQRGTTSKSAKRTITARHPDGLEPRFDLYGPGRAVPFRRFGLREGAAGELPGQEKAARRARCCVSPGAGTATSRCAVVRRKGLSGPASSCMRWECTYSTMYGSRASGSALTAASVCSDPGFIRTPFAANPCSSG